MTLSAVFQDTEDKKQLEENIAKLKITEEKLRIEAEVDITQIAILSLSLLKLTMISF